MLDVTIWGSRGSVPVSGERFREHGGATTCLEIEAPTSAPEGCERLIIDGGTGLADLGRSWGDRGQKATFLQTHMHWDHIQGYPFFGPFYNHEGRHRLLAVRREGRGLGEVLARQMARPNFPIGLESLPATLTFNDLPKNGSLQLGEVTLKWAEMWHPSGSTGYRIEHRGASVVFSGDVEVAMGSRDALVELARGADVLIMDAQYMPDEYPSRAGFGHSTPLDAVDVALAAGVGCLVMTHHDPCHDDHALRQKQALARQRASGTGLIVDNARDGMTLRVGSDALSLELDEAHATAAV